MVQGPDEAEQSATEDRILVGKLRDIAERLAEAGCSPDADTLLSCAAHIEGHNEAFRTVIDEKRELNAELRATRSNHQHTLEFVDRWRQLIVVLQLENPGDIRLRRALAGEHPLRAAPWERQS